MASANLPINAPPPERVAHATLRGAIAAMAMTGARVLTTELGLIEEPPPQAIFRQRAKGLLKLAPRRHRRAVIELAHWGFGAGGGAAFALLPRDVRDRAWAGPVYGLAVWVGFEAVLSPLLGLEQATKPRPLERVMLAADHALYGLVLSEFRQRPRE
ncbi:MAG TPA: hypothetical protein VGG40_03730 [Solirubrobacterales bacterium]|jgi:hypothetical protein